MGYVRGVTDIVGLKQVLASYLRFWLDSKLNCRREPTILNKRAYPFSSLHSSGLNATIRCANKPNYGDIMILSDSNIRYTLE